MRKQPEEPTFEHREEHLFKWYDVSGSIGGS